MPPLRTAIVGLGRIGMVHAQNCLTLAEKGFPVEVVAIVEPISEKREAFAEILARRRAPPALALTSVDELIDMTSLDAAIVASTTASHHTNARKCTKTLEMFPTNKSVTNTGKYSTTIAIVGVHSNQKISKKQWWIYSQMRVMNAGKSTQNNKSWGEKYFHGI